MRKAYWTAFTAWHARVEAQLPYWPRERILGVQARRVRALVAHAYRTVPYYKDVMDATRLRPADFRSADDLARLPLLSGDQLAREPERFRSRSYKHGHGVELNSSGTSGRLRRIHYDPAALFLSLAHGHRQRLVFALFVGRTYGYREMIAVRPGNIGTRIREFYESSSWVPKQIELTRCLLSPAEPFATQVARLNEFQPEVLSGYGSHLGALLRRVIVEQVQIARPRLIMYGGDRMADADRTLIERELGVPVISTYQAAEVLRLGFQCEMRRGFHISEDHVAVRVIDDDGRAVGAGGTGAIVVSNLVNRSTVILNYTLGDIVTLSDDRCECGRTLPTIDRIEGRADDALVLPGGEQIHALVLQAALHRVPGVIQVQIIQEELRRFLIRAVFVGDHDWLQAREQLIGAVKRLLGRDIAVAVERTESLALAPSDKVKAVISRVKRD